MGASHCAPGGGPTTDFMTAHWAELPCELRACVSSHNADALRYSAADSTQVR